MRQADGDAKYGDQNTDASRASQVLRRVTTCRRRCSHDADRGQPSAGTSNQNRETRNHKVVHRSSKRTLPFSELVDAAAKLPVPKQQSIVLRPEMESCTSTTRICRCSTEHDRQRRIGADVNLPNLLIAVIARPPAVGSKWLRYDAQRALAVPGVKRIIAMPAPEPPWNFQPWGGVAVVAENTWAALRGRAELDVTWDPGPNAAYGSAPFRDELFASVRASGKVLREVGDVDAAFAKAAKVVEAEYHVPHLPHLQMEPLVATAPVKTIVAKCGRRRRIRRAPGKK